MSETPPVYHTSSPLPCSVNPRHGRSVAVVHVNGETRRLCAACRDDVHVDLAVASSEKAMIGLLVTGLSGLLMGLLIGWLVWGVR